MLNRDLRLAAAPERTPAMARPIARGGGGPPPPFDEIGLFELAGRGKENNKYLFKISFIFDFKNCF